MDVKRIRIWILEFDVYRGALLELRKAGMEVFKLVPDCDMKAKITIEMEEVPHE